MSRDLLIGAAAATLPLTAIAAGALLIAIGDTAAGAITALLRIAGAL